MFAFNNINAGIQKIFFKKNVKWKILTKDKKLYVSYFNWFDYLNSHFHSIYLILLLFFVFCPLSVKKANPTIHLKINLLKNDINVRFLDGNWTLKALCHSRPKSLKLKYTFDRRYILSICELDFSEYHIY